LKGTILGTIQASVRVPRESICIGNSPEIIKTMPLHRIRRNRPVAGSGAESSKDDLNLQMQGPHSHNIVINTFAISDSRHWMSRE
jgi:hypothetical protein